MRLAIVGTGLIGCSVALAAREKLGAGATGWDPDPDSLAAAAERGALTPTASLADAVAQAEVVFVAAPVAELGQIVEQVLSLVGPDVLVTDVGSVKRGVVNANRDPRFVGGHPLAGREIGGAAHAQPDLFEGATWYLTPTETTAGVQLERAFRLLTDLGARPRVLSAEVHDQILATVSHLPHVFANLLVTEAGATLAAEGEPLPAIGPSFRDSTRVAGAPSSIWVDIYRANSDAIIERLRRVEADLAKFRAMLEADDSDAIKDWNELAAAEHRRLLVEGLDSEKTTSISVRVPNQSGVLAEIALTLGGAGIDLTDLQLHPAADRATGTIVLWVPQGEQAERAIGLIAELGHSVSEV